MREQRGAPAPPAWGEGWRRREGTTYRGASTVAACSEAVARSVLGDYGIPRQRVQVVGAGADVVPPRVERRDDGRTLLFAGREFEHEGGRILVEAFRRLRRRRPRAVLRIAGPPAALDLPPGAEQLGRVPRSDLPRLLAEATAFVLPTLREPCELAYLDAMACAVPCIGTRVGAVPEIVEDGRTGLLVPPADPGALAAAMERLLDEPALARGLGERGRERVLARFTWSHVARALEPLLAAARIVPDALPGCRPATPCRGASRTASP